MINLFSYCIKFDTHQIRFHVATNLFPVKQKKNGCRNAVSCKWSSDITSNIEKIICYFTIITYQFTYSYNFCNKKIDIYRLKDYTKMQRIYVHKCTSKSKHDKSKLNYMYSERYICFNSSKIILILYKINHDNVLYISFRFVGNLYFLLCLGKQTRY